MNIFLDSGILLDFYRISSNEAELYKKITTLIKNNAVSIYLTEQVKHEFSRMKEDIIQAALDDFCSLKISMKTPPIFGLDTEYRNLVDKAKLFNDALGKLHSRFTEQFKHNEFEADTLINVVFKNAEYHETTPELLERARNRLEIRNPPGKINELGDRLNWETLLKWEETNNKYSRNKDNDFYIISNDGDYFRNSSNKTAEIKLFLQNEWNNKKENTIFGYRSLKDFFIEKFPKQKLATDLEKEVVINSFENSSSFSETHYIIKKLNNINNLTNKEVNRIIEAYINNDQIRSIYNDSDVYSYLNLIIEHNREAITDSNKEKLKLLFNRS